MFEPQIKKEPLLSVEHVGFSYAGKTPHDFSLLRDVSFEMQRGEFLCLLGASGCGKTTLLRLISGLEIPHTGKITISGSGATKYGPRVGMVFQDLALFPHMSAARNIGYALRHLSRAERRSRIDEMLDLVGLAEKRNAYPHQLSGGQKQRLALARALAHHPDLLLLDEPFASQDVLLRAQMRDDVMHILRDAGVAALLVTHDPEEAMQFADRIVIMNKGTIEQIGSPYDVYNKPQNPYVASFFGQVNSLQGHVQKGQILTPLGTFSAPDFADETPVKIIIRPEALRLQKHDPSINHHNSKHIHVHGQVSEQRYLGRSTLVHLDVYDVDGCKQDNNKVRHLHARVPGQLGKNDNSVQDIFLDHSQIFIFKDEAA